MWKFKKQLFFILLKPSVLVENITILRDDEIY